jgi:hypothetical protein
VGASERDEFLRAAWRVLVARRVESGRFVFVDECSTNTSLTPLYAWSRRGERARCSTPRNRGANVTLLSSMSLEGMGPSLVVEGSLLEDKGAPTKAEARSRERLMGAIGGAISAVTPREAKGFFEHRGYRLVAQQP